MSDLGYSLPPPADPLSKSAQKKLIRQERLALLKAEKKQEKKDERKRKRGDQDPAPAPSEPSTSTADANAKGDVIDQRKRKRAKVDTRNAFNATLLIDLGFDDLMFDKEIISLCSQLHYSYGANRRAKNPFRTIMITSLSGKARARLEGTGDGTAHTRWKDVIWHEKGYQYLFEPTETTAEVGDEQPTIESAQDGEALKLQKDKIIYLTADSQNELEVLEEGSCYILGGIVDHNRYKNLCLRKAEGHAVRTARLPIGKYMTELQTRKVLTVNQVVDIMLSWIEHRDWGKAFDQVIPKRKLKGPDGHEDLTVTEEEVALEQFTED